jgi:hypothetical protein
VSRWQTLQDDIAAFTQKTFGESTARSKALHLAEEAREAADDPADAMEWADCLILLLDAARIAGFSTDDLYAAAQRKMEINRARQWGQPDGDGIVRHIKE